MKMCRDLVGGAGPPEPCLSLIFSVKYFTFKTFQLLLFHCSGSDSASVSGVQYNCSTALLLADGGSANNLIVQGVPKKNAF